MPDYRTMPLHLIAGRTLRRLPTWTTPAALALVSAGLAPGCLCANTEYQRAHSKALREAVDAYRHGGSEATVRSDVENALIGEGYSMTPGADETDWRSTGADNRERIRIALSSDHGILSSDHGISVRLFAKTETLSPQRFESKARTRRDDLERKLLEALVPESEKTASDVEVMNFEYDLPADQLWEQIMLVGDGDGYPLDRYAVAVDSTVSSQWVTESETRRRLDVHVTKLKHRQYAVTIHQLDEAAVGERTWEGPREQRHHDLEFAVIERADPGRAQAINDDAARAGQEAYDNAIDRGAMSCGHQG